MNVPNARLLVRAAKRLSYDTATGVTPMTVAEGRNFEDRRAAPGRVASRVNPNQQAIGGLSHLYSAGALKAAVAKAKLRRGKAH